MNRRASAALVQNANFSRADFTNAILRSQDTPLGLSRRTPNSRAALTLGATKLIVGNLSFNTTEGQILDLFKQARNNHGQIC
jgi:hypothetical protein